MSKTETLNRQLPNELVEDELNLVVGGWLGWTPPTPPTSKKEADAIKGFQQMLQELP
jgi:hypothetical protein